MAFSGRFDFTRYDPLDSYHRARLKLALSYEERSRLLDTTRDTFLYMLSVANTPGNITHESRVKLQDKAFETLRKRHSVTFPWNIAPDEASSGPTESEIEALRAEWIRIWGDPNDPKVAAEIQKVSDQLMSETKALKLQAARNKKIVGTR